MGVLAACNRVGDEYCDVGTDLTDPSDQCPYGPPGGPGSHSDGCQAILINTTAECAKTSSTWAGPDGIWYAQIGTSCSTGGCHEMGAGGIKLPLADATTAYNTLKAYNKPDLGSYISDSDPAHTWVLCNLQGLKTGGSGMPLGRMLPAGAFDAVKRWAECGEKLGTDNGGGITDAGAD